MKEYNFIIAGGEGFYSVAYSDLKRCDNVRYFENYIDGILSPLMRILVKLCFNLKINRYINTPFKHIAYKKIYPAQFSTDRPLCFIFFGTQFAVINTDYLEYLRVQYPSVKLVLYMQDIVSSLPYYDILNYKKRFDLILSYDCNDCKKYGLEYYPTPFSYIAPDKFVKREPIDVYFCGSAKTRYPEILRVYQACKEQGLKCKFFITGVPEADRIKSEEIIYDRRISYIDNLSYIYASKCIVEIMQANAVGFTPRLWEALFYNKHLLTNNTNIITSNYYNADQIHLIDKDKIIMNYVDNIVKTDQNFLLKKTPLNLIKYIVPQLN